jgi:hypothetical protein
MNGNVCWPKITKELSVTSESFPDSVDDLILTQETSVILGQEPKHFKGLGPELYIRAVPSQALGRTINDKPFDHRACGRDFGIPTHPPLGFDRQGRGL